MAQGPFAGRVKIINGATVSGQVHVSCVESVGYTKVKYTTFPEKLYFLGGFLVLIYLPTAQVVSGCCNLYELQI